MNPTRYVLRIFAVLGIGFECAIASLAYAADNSTLAKFARANADKYGTEIVPVNGITVGSRVTVAFTDYTSILEYDGTTLAGKHFVRDILHVSMVCRSVGSHVGQNGYGARFKVEEKNCDIVNIADFSASTESEISLLISPSVYRQIKNDGIPAEAEYIITTDKGQSVGFEVADDPGTMSDPIDYHSRIWTINAILKGVVWHVPGNPEPFVVWAPKEPAPPTASAACLLESDVKALSDAEVHDAGCVVFGLRKGEAICPSSRGFYMHEIVVRRIKLTDCK